MLIKIDDITVQTNRRKLRDVSELAESIKTIGLLNPITIAENNILIAGLHRLEACKTLGWNEIEANILSLNEVDCQLAELDENLIRNELSVLERSEQLAKRKELYEAKNPHTRHGAIGNGRSRDAESATLNFAKDTAKKTSVSTRTIAENVQIANRIPEQVRDIIRETPLADKKTELLTLSRFDGETQKQVVEMITENKAETVESALVAIAKTPAPEGFKSAEAVAKEHKESAGTKWRDSLYKLHIDIQSIDKLGGIKQLSEKWNDGLKRQYIDRCRGYAETLINFAEELEETL